MIFASFLPNSAMSACGGHLRPSTYRTLPWFTQLAGRLPRRPDVLDLGGWDGREAPVFVGYWSWDREGLLPVV